jgi:hypothetical protein
MAWPLVLALAAGLGALAPAGEPPVVRVRPIAAHRGLPHVFHDQALESLKATAPNAQFVERLRAERLGGLTYALVAWKPDPTAARVEVGAVAVADRRAWHLDLTAPVGDYPAARAALLARLQALASAPSPKAEITLRAGGRAVKVGDASELLWDVEALTASCQFSTAPPDLPAGGALELIVRYAEPRALGLTPRRIGAAPAEEEIAIESIRIVADPVRNTGWPIEVVRHAGGEVGLVKCDGAGTLRLLCRPELRRHAPSTVTSGCRLVPR